MTAAVECPVCTRRVGVVWSEDICDEAYVEHRFSGRAPAVWLRPGERCPASGTVLWSTLPHEWSPGSLASLILAPGFTPSPFAGSLALEVTECDRWMLLAGRSAGAPPAGDQAPA